MSEHLVSIAQAEIHGLTEQLELRTRERDEARHERDQYKRERDEARAILARVKTSLNERFDDPMEEGAPGHTNA